MCLDTRSFFLCNASNLRCLFCGPHRRGEENIWLLLSYCWGYFFDSYNMSSETDASGNDLCYMSSLRRIQCHNDPGDFQSCVQ